MFLKLDQLMHRRQRLHRGGERHSTRCLRSFLTRCGAEGCEARSPPRSLFLSAVRCLHHRSSRLSCHRTLSLPPRQEGMHCPSMRCVLRRVVGRYHSRHCRHPCLLCRLHQLHQLRDRSAGDCHQSVALWRPKLAPAIGRPRCCV
ncbi:unnamed protein product, partial [Ectocarpus sp. 12 AP-2014]